MSIWFHGTNKKASEEILKNGFKKGTYFAQHLESSLSMGGKYIFWVWFDKDPSDYWEYICDKKISKSKILLLRKYATQKLYCNDSLEEHIRFQNNIEFHSPIKIKACKTCRGKGEFNNREFDDCAKGKYGKVCPDCIGFGCTYEK